MAEHLLLTFPETRATEPVIYRIVKDFDVVPNIRRAAIETHRGWMVVELDGDHDSVQQAKAYLEAQGIGVERAEGDIVAG
jgi:ABC-type methionine transport system ATPase subunit